ncbi:MAG: polyhydroxyalkanoate synthesis repressor PhaR [Alphaproteobacteria bacterium]
MAQTDESKSAPITIKKYANRRLYNTATSSYVTLDDLCQMVKQGVEFTVFDAKTGDDITRSVLTQIIVEEEGKGQNLLPISFLRQLIGFYGDSLQGLVPRYLEQSMRAFIHNQERMRQYVQSTLGGMFPFAQFEEMGKQNMAMMEQAMKMFSPFGGEGGTPPESGSAPGTAEPPAKLDELQKKIDALEKQMEQLGRQKRD